MQGFALTCPHGHGSQGHVSTTHVCSRDSARAQRFGMVDPKSEVGYGMLWCEGYYTPSVVWQRTNPKGPRTEIIGF